MAEFKRLVPQNIAPPGARRIGAYHSRGTRAGTIPLGHLKFPEDAGNLLYSFGALADVHYQVNTAAEDFARAMKYLRERAAFTCICGDLTQSGTAENLAEYKACVDANSGGMPVYAITGNHEGYNSAIESAIATYTGHPLYYSFTQGDDVFIMVGIKDDGAGALFTKAELQWLYEVLEANRNKRCFLFQHVRPDDACGNAFGIYAYDIWGGTEQIVFESLLRHYKNVVFFHGHSHLKFAVQDLYGEGANIDTVFGIPSIHIPSLSVPRGGDASGASSRVELYAESEGYLVAAYEYGIHLIGRDFVSNVDLPIAGYWIPTKRQTVPAKTYTDSTGTINT